MDEELLLPEKENAASAPVVYFSVNSESKAGKRLIEAADLLGIFDSYTSTGEGRYYSRYKLCKPDAKLLATEVADIINGLFPVLDKKDIEAGIYTRDAWMEMEDE